MWPHARALVLFGVAVLTLSACGDGGSPSGPNPPAALSKLTGDNQTGDAGQPLPVAPAVRVTDAGGAPVSGVAVTFAVTGGGGSVAGGSASTDGDGIARVTSWTLGNQAGPNTLTASVAASGVTGNPATFTATGRAGAARNLVKDAGDNQTSPAGGNVPVAPAVRVTDQFGNAVSGVTVTFAVASGGGSVTGGTPTTGADGRAAVGSWRLGAAAGPNTLTATIPGTGITGNPATFSATGQVANFEPAGNVSIGGEQNFVTVNIPAGVTVTATSDLVLTATASVTIAGTLAGDCRAITVSSEGALTVSGTVRNACAAASEAPPTLTLVGKGGYALNSGSTISTSGALDITNDPTLTDDDFAISAVPAMVGASSQAPVCLVVNASFTANPATAAPGSTGGSMGGNGKDGSTWTLKCRGSLQMQGSSVTGQNGGAGGAGTSTSSSNAEASGGRGGTGGDLHVLATAEMLLGGTNTFTSGTGGAGGTATATGTTNPAPARAPSATATGGQGGRSGLITVRGRQGIAISTLNLNIGAGGAGGNATATGADGVDATAVKPAQHGGNATATGGVGGDTPDKTLGSSGNVVGLAGVNVTGGAGGRGGDATATAGKGGNGIRENKPGGEGGSQTANGAKGGDAQVRDRSGTLIGPGGAGGMMTLRRGLGGNGYVDCVDPFTTGGAGGMGGDGAGNSGLGGTGAAAGAPGTITVDQAGNGGSGGNGLGPGGGGDPGTSTGIGSNGARTNVESQFKPGAPGNPCPGTITRAGVVSPPSSDPHSHEPILVQVGTRDVTVTFTSGTTMRMRGLLRGSTTTFSGARPGSTFTMSGTTTVTTDDGPRTVSVVIQGTITETGLEGTMRVTVSGFPQPTVYPFSIPF